MAAASSEDTLSAVSDLSLGRNGDLQEALVCTTGKLCKFSSAAKLVVEDTAETPNNRKKDAKRDLEFTLDYHVEASCRSSGTDKTHRFFRVQIDSVVGGDSAKAHQLAKRPFFFVQSEETGRLVRMYTSKQDSKPAKLIKHGLVASMTKKFSRKAQQTLSELAIDLQSGNATSSSPLVYDFEGTDLNGPYVAHHEISTDPEDVDGLLLVETKDYKESPRGRDSDRRAIDIKQKAKARVQMDRKGRLKKMRANDELSVGSSATPKQPAVQKLPDMGKSKFQLEFDVVRVGKEPHASCKDAYLEVSSLDLFERGVNQLLDGAESRDLDTPYTDAEMNYSDIEDVPADALADHALTLLAVPGVELADVAAYFDARSGPIIVHHALDMYSAGEIPLSSLKVAIATLGGVPDGAVQADLAVLATDTSNEEAVRSQAMQALRPGADMPPVSSDILDHVSRAAFDPEDPLSDEATLLLGSLCDNNPAGDEFVTQLEQERDAGSSDDFRMATVQHALDNAQASLRAVSSVADLETSLDVEEGVEDLDDLSRTLDDTDADFGALEREGESLFMDELDMGLSGSKTFINKNWRLCGNKNFQVTSAANAGASWNTDEAKITASAGMTAKILETSRSLLSADFNAKAQGNTIGYKWNFKIAGHVVKSGGASRESKYVKYGGNCPTKFGDSPQAKAMEWGKTFFKFSQRFMLSVVPVKVHVEVLGMAGIKIHIGGWINCRSKALPDGDIAILGGAKPWGKVVVKASAAVDGYVAKAGVLGAITVLNGGLPVYGIGTLKQGCGKIDLNLGAGAGEIKLFAEVGVSPCPKDKVKGPCGQVSWNEFQKWYAGQCTAKTTPTERSAKYKQYKKDGCVVTSDCQVTGKTALVDEHRPSSELATTDEESPLINADVAWSPWRAIRNVASRVVRGARAAYGAVKGAAKAAACRLHKRWEKSILSWNGGSMKKNFVTACFPLQLGKFFKGKNDKKNGQDNMGNKTATNSTGITRPKDGVTPNPTGVAKKEGQRTGKTARDEGAQTRDTARKDAAKTGKTARKQGSATKKAVDEAAASTKSTVANQGQKTRKTARKAGRSAKAKASAVGDKNKRAGARAAGRVEKAVASTRKAERRATDKAKATLDGVKAAEQRKEDRDLVRRQGDKEAKESKRTVAAARRKQERDRMRRVSEGDKESVDKLKRMIRDDEEKNKERRNFKRLRDKDRRSVARNLRRGQEQNMRKFLRRQSDAKGEVKKDMDAIKRKLSGEAERKRERERLARVGKEVKDSKSSRREMRRDMNKLKNKAQDAGAKIKQQSTRAARKVRNAQQRARGRNASRRNVAKQKRAARRAANRGRRSRHNKRYRAASRKDFTRGRRQQRRTGRRVDTSVKRQRRRARTRRAQRRLAATTRRTARRNRRTVRANTRRNRRKIKAQQRKLEAARRAARARKRVSRTRKNFRHVGRRSRKAVEEGSRRNARRNRRGGRRQQHASQRAGRRGARTGRTAGLDKKMNDVNDEIRGMAQSMNLDP